MTDHPTAADYRNRAERAEAEAREAWAEADKLAKALEAIMDCDLTDPVAVVSHNDETAMAALAAYEERKMA